MATTKKARAIKTYENGTKRFATLVNGKGLDNFEKIFPLLPPEYNWLCMNMDGQVWGYIDKPVEAKYHCYFVGVNNERGIWVGENFDCGFGHWQNSVVHRDNHQAVLAEKTKAISGTVSEQATKPVPAEVQEIIISQRAAIRDLFFMIGTSQPTEELLLESANQFVGLMSSLGHGGLVPESIVADFVNKDSDALKNITLDEIKDGLRTVFCTVDSNKGHYAIYWGGKKHGVQVGPSYSDFESLAKGYQSAIETVKNRRAKIDTKKAADSVLRKVTDMKFGEDFVHRGVHYRSCSPSNDHPYERLVIEIDRRGGVAVNDRMINFIPTY